MAGIDFDIEGGHSQDLITNLVKRVKVDQSAYPKLRFSFTLQTSGGNSKWVPQNQLNALGAMVLTAIQSIGLNWNNVFINLMVMDFGSSSWVCVIGSNGNCDMDTSSIVAAESLHKAWNVPYSSIELTPMYDRRE